MIEIERKFLVTSDAYKSESSSKTTNNTRVFKHNPERTVRVRIKDTQGFIT